MVMADGYIEHTLKKQIQRAKIKRFFMIQLRLDS